LQITPTCQHQFLKIKIQWTTLNLWTTNLWKLTTISLKMKMYSNCPLVHCNHHSRQLQQEHQEGAQEDPHQEGSLAMNWPMFVLNYCQHIFKKPAECKTSIQMNKSSFRRLSIAPSTQTNLPFKNKDNHHDLIRKDKESFSKPKRYKNSYWSVFFSKWFYSSALSMLRTNPTLMPNIIRLCLKKLIDVQS
jgi:hypothetical protein